MSFQKELENFEKWMYGYKGWSFSTIQKTIQKVKYLKRLGLDITKFRNMNLEEIQKTLINFFAEQRKRGKTRKTLNGYIKIINRYLQFLGLDYKVKYFPDYSEESISVPSDEEVRRILKVRWIHPDVDLRNRAMIHLVFATGIRLSELVNLNWNDLDLINKTIKIRSGKFEKTREIPVPPRVIKLLLEYKKVRLRTDPNAMFTSHKGRITESYVRKIFKEAGEKAGVPGFHIHAARHWRAIKWIDQGIDLDAVRVLLGHKHLKSTQIYIRKRPINKIFNQVIQKDKFFWTQKEIKEVDKNEK